MGFTAFFSPLEMELWAPSHDGSLLIAGDGAHFVGMCSHSKNWKNTYDIWGCIGVKSTAYQPFIYPP